jgi:hypothetical protein
VIKGDEHSETHNRNGKALHHDEALESTLNRGYQSMLTRALRRNASARLPRSRASGGAGIRFRARGMGDSRLFSCCRYAPLVQRATGNGSATKREPDVRYQARAARHKPPVEGVPGLASPLVKS